MKLITTLFLILGISVAGYSSQYEIDEQAIDASFEASQDVSYMLGTPEMDINFSLIAADEEAAKSQMTAAIIAFASIVIPYVVFTVTGGLGVVLFIATMLPWHRLYLGTGGNTGKIFGLYCITLDWCGWLTFIDGVMLLLDDTETKYVEHPKYVMWMN